jgi:hypothetical protein
LPGRGAVKIKSRARVASPGVIRVREELPKGITESNPPGFASVRAGLSRARSSENIEPGGRKLVIWSRKTIMIFIEQINSKLHDQKRRCNGGKMQSSLKFVKIFFNFYMEMIINYVYSQRIF